MKAMLTFLVAIVALLATLAGLFMVNFPSGGVFGLNHQFLSELGLRDYFVPGLLLTTIGVVSIVAFFSLTHSYHNQFRWSISAGSLFLFYVLLSLLMSQSNYGFQLILLGAGIMIVFMSLQLRGKWIT